MPGGRCSREFSEKQALPFIGLPEPRVSVLKLYGQGVALFKRGRMPARVLIDKTRVGSYVHYGHSMRDIIKNEEPLDLGDGLKALPGRALAI